MSGKDLNETTKPVTFVKLQLIILLYYIIYYIIGYTLVRLGQGHHKCLSKRKDEL